MPRCWTERWKFWIDIGQPRDCGTINLRFAESCSIDETSFLDVMLAAQFEFLIDPLLPYS